MTCMENSSFLVINLNSSLWSKRILKKRHALRSIDFAENVAAALDIVKKLTN